MRITNIELKIINPEHSNSASLILTTSSGEVYSFGSHETGATKIKESARGTRPNKIDSRVLEALSDINNWQAPSHRQLAEIVGCHYSYIQKAIKNLQKENLIDIDLKPVKDK